MRHLVLAMLVALLLASLASASGSSSFAYIASSATNSVIPVATSDNGVQTSIPVGTHPYGVAVSPDGTRVYVTNFMSSSVSVIDTAKQSVVTVGIGSFPSGIAVSPAGDWVYAVSSGTGNLYTICTSNSVVICPSRDTVTGSVRVGSVPRGVAADPNASRVYVTNRNGGGTLAVVDVSTPTAPSIVGTPILLGGDPLGVAADERWLYVGRWQWGQIVVLDLANNFQKHREFAVGAGPYGLALDSERSRLYVANELSGTVSIVDTSLIGDTTKNPVIGQPIPVGVSPRGISVTGDGRRVYVVNFGSNSVSVIENDTVQTTFAVGLSPISFGNFVTRGSPVTVDIKPGANPNVINRKSKGTIPVAILSAAGFDATLVDERTVTLAGVPAAMRPNGTYMAALDDVNGDGLMDFVFHVRTEDLVKALTSAVSAQGVADISVVVAGATTNGKAFEGTDSVKFTD